MTQRRDARERALILFASILMVVGVGALAHVLTQDPRPMLERVLQRGELIIATRRTPRAYFEGIDGADGFEYALSKRFAKTLGVTPRYVFPRTVERILDATARGEVHFAAAGLSVTARRQLRLDFSPAYHQATPQLVYRRGDRRPRRFDDITSGNLHVVDASSYADTLERLRQTEGIDLEWDVHAAVSGADLLAAVDQGEIRYTIANSVDLSLYQRFHPRVSGAFEIGEPRPIAWAFPKSSDDSLRHAADLFLQSMIDSGELERLKARYFDHLGRLNFVDARTFWRDVRERLPKLRGHFELAAEETGIDWRLLAAIGYQESHWRADAVSPTGVRGVMMLTQAAADEMGVSDRGDPRQSILGGARYLRVTESKLPERIAEPNRLWLTLAGYNVGFGHLEDARILTQRAGDDPDRWSDVKQYLPLLTQKRYYQTVRHGFARGKEPVEYVENIRNYFDLLLWHTAQRPSESVRSHSAAIRPAG